MVFWGSPLYPRAFSIQEGTGFLSTAGRHEENAERPVPHPAPLRPSVRRVVPRWRYRWRYVGGGSRNHVIPPRPDASVLCPALAGSASRNLLS